MLKVSSPKCVAKSHAQHGFPPARERRIGCAYSTAFTIDSITFFASPNTIIVFGW
jgi:hypothetical protein